MSVSIYENCLNPKVYANVEVDDIIDYIKTNKQAKSVRGYKNLSFYDKEKLKLPSVTWGATFNPIRHQNNILQESGFIYFDIDNYSDKKYVSEIPETYAVWYSLSGNGLGGIIKSNCDRSNYSSTYKEFGKKYNLPLDKTSDVTRLNIISYDTDIFVNKNSKVFEKVESESIVYEVTPYDNLHSLGCDIAFNSTLKKNIKYEKGSRHFFVLHYGFLTNVFGIPLEVSLNYLYSKGIFTQDDFDLETDLFNVYKSNVNKFKTTKINNLANELYRI